MASERLADALHMFLQKRLGDGAYPTWNFEEYGKGEIKYTYNPVVSTLVGKELFDLMKFTMPVLKDISRPTVVDHAVRRTMSKEKNFDVNPSKKITDEQFVNWSSRCFMLTKEHIYKAAKNYKVYRQCTAHASTEEIEKFNELLENFGGVPLKDVKSEDLSSTPTTPVRSQCSMSTHSAFSGIKGSRPGRTDFENFQGGYMMMQSVQRKTILSMKEDPDDGDDHIVLPQPPNKKLKRLAISTSEALCNAKIAIPGAPAVGARKLDLKKKKAVKKMLKDAAKKKGTPTMTPKRLSMKSSPAMSVIKKSKSDYIKPESAYTKHGKLIVINRPRTAYMELNNEGQRKRWPGVTLADLDGLDLVPLIVCSELFTACVKYEYNLKEATQLKKTMLRRLQEGSSLTDAVLPGA